MEMRGIIIFCLVSFCVNKISSNNGVKVINGKDAEKGQFPWQVLVASVTTNNNYIFCGGAVISNIWILTSASCINQAYTVVVFSGVSDLNDTSYTLSTTTNFIIHEDFDNQTLQNNIGLVRLDKPLVLDGNTEAIKLAEDILERETNVTIAGWGHSSHDTSEIVNLTEVLQYVNVPIITNLECAKIYGSTVVDANVVCTKNLDTVKSPCLNDGGSPLVANADTDPVHVGIFSFLGENGCKNNYPAGYVRTYSYRNWIKEKANV